MIKSKKLTLYPSQQSEEERKSQALQVNVSVVASHLLSFSRMFRVAEHNYPTLTSCALDVNIKWRRKWNFAWQQPGFTFTQHTATPCILQGHIRIIIHTYTHTLWKCVHVWVNEWMNEWLVEWVNGLLVSRLNGKCRKCKRGKYCISLCNAKTEIHRNTHTYIQKYVHK